MSIGNIRWLSVVLMGALSGVPSSAAEKTDLTAAAASPGAPAPPTPAAYKQTFMFPPTGIANDSEAVRITATNVAPNGPNGKNASCNVEILFNDSLGGLIQNTAPTQIPNLGSGQIGMGYYAPVAPAPGIPLQRTRIELQGLVKLTIDPTKWAPCSLLLTLEVYDATTNITHAFITAAIQAPIADGVPGFGRGR